MPNAFSNKRIVLTGGTDGIGLALAHRLVAQGANLMIIGRQPADKAPRPSASHYFCADLGMDESPQKIADHLATMGWHELHYLIHNASGGYVGQIAAQTPSSIATLIAVNLKAPLALSQLLYPALARTTGTLCFIGSTVKGRTTPDFAVYTATKTALSDLARNLATEWQQRVRVIEVNPGPTRTAFHAKAGLENPPFAKFFMSAEEVAAGIEKSLKTGKRRKDFSITSLLIHAIRRSFNQEKS